MPRYLVESRHHEMVNHGGVIRGVRARFRDPLYLYVLSTEQDPLWWPERVTALPHELDNRRAPVGVVDWWMVTHGARAVWPGTLLRSSFLPLESMVVLGCEEESVLRWP